MNIKKIAGIVFLLFASVMVCSANYGKLKPQSGNESKVSQRELTFLVRLRHMA